MTVVGGCLCGAVRMRIDGPLRPVVACHCEQCRKTSGHYVAATSALLEHVTVEEDGALRWYRSSPKARRGFCSICGSSLFWQVDGADRVSIHAGALEAPTGLAISGHIFCAARGDYYDIDPGVPRFDGDGPEVTGP